MLRKICWVAIFLSAASFSQQSRGQTNISLGAEPRVDTLFTIDSGSGANTLYQIVRGYIASSLLRDRFGSPNVTVQNNGGTYVASVANFDDQQYADKFTNILNAGDVAYAAVQTMQAAGRWKSEWQFLMPLGMAIINNKTLEIMDFPPNTLITKRDYLNSKTTDRWFALLEENGVSSSGVQGFTAILDIAPIAAPANDGQSLLDYNAYGGDFDLYTSQMLDLWTSIPGAQLRKPAMAFGSPIRKWLSRLYGLTLNVLDVATIPMGGGAIPILGSNHPSYIFYVPEKHPNDPDAAFADAFYVMQQDLAASCWQAEMGNDPKQDPTKIRDSCVTNWKGQNFEICKLTETQVFHMTASAASSACNQKTLPPPPLANEMLMSFPGNDVQRTE
jgi:hypothetical protein